MSVNVKPVFPGDPPVDPGPTASPAVRRWFAEDNAYHSLLKKRWEDWILNHPEDAEVTATHSFGVPPVAPELFAPKPAVDPNPRPDGTTRRNPVP